MNEQIRQLIEKADRLIAARVTVQDTDFKIWKNQAERAIASGFGEGSHEYRQMHEINFSPVVTCGAETHDEFADACKSGILLVKEILESALTKTEPIKQEVSKMNNQRMQKIFIVHGHDINFRNEVQICIMQLGFKAIILDQQENLGRTVIEKLEQCGEADAAIVLVTPDDVVKEKNEDELKKRARQNVVFEAGFFMGRLGRDRVILLVKDKDDGKDKDVNALFEIPSDCFGIVYQSDEWKLGIARDLKAMGFDVDANKLF